jgi:hypothetical protein
LILVLWFFCCPVLSHRLHGVLHFCMTHVLIFCVPTHMGITHTHGPVCRGTSSSSCPQILIVEVHGAITSKWCLICQKHVQQRRRMNIHVFWDVMLCRWASGTWCPKGRGFSSPWKMYLSWTAGTWRWRHYVPLKCWEPLTQWLSIMSQKTWIFSNTVVRTSALTEKEDYWHIATGATDKVGCYKIRLWV